MTALPHLDNASARRLFLYRHGLSGAQDPDLLALIQRLGFVQVDSINTVERAHHMILGARRRSYRPKHLKQLLEKDRSLFEHWTHDASVIPTDFFPYWRLRFRRDGERLWEKWHEWRRHGFAEKLDEVLEHVRTNGPVMSRDTGADEKKGSGGWWDWHPSKTALEYLWRRGDIAVCHRQGFQKAYDLTERVLPHGVNAPHLEEHEIIDWACNAALDRLGFATSGDIAAFWDMVTAAEAKTWAAQQSGLIEIEVEGTNGKLRKHFARPDVMAQAQSAPEAPGSIRVLSPFDPALRDRARAERLFGFRYRIEVFVPQPKRTYGYYVFPILEGDRLIGRIDMKRHTDTGCLMVKAFWPEPGVKLGKGRIARLDAELARMARFAGCQQIVHTADWLREPVLQS
ncbi:MAG: winged helix-turn-helix domain-containing protein [Paracoccaceae bacterium]